MLLLLAVPFVQKVAAPRPVLVQTCDPAHFIAKAYQDLLGRPINVAGLQYWQAAITNGTTRAQVASQLLHTPEYANARVQTFYNAYLHRPADGSAIAYFSPMLQHGGTSEQIEALILASPEYFTRRGGGTNPGFIAALYQDVLGRVADPQGSALFVGQLGAGASRTTIAQQVLSSPEARQRAINAAYMKYLHHGAPGSALGFGYDQIVETIIGSDEYCAH